MKQGGRERSVSWFEGGKTRIARQVSESSFRTGLRFLVDYEIEMLPGSIWDSQKESIQRRRRISKLGSRSFSTSKTSLPRIQSRSLFQLPILCVIDLLFRLHIPDFPFSQFQPRPLLSILTCYLPADQFDKPWLIPYLGNSLEEAWVKTKSPWIFAWMICTVTNLFEKRTTNLYFGALYLFFAWATNFLRAK